MQINNPSDSSYARGHILGLCCHLLVRFHQEMAFSTVLQFLTFAPPHNQADKEQNVCSCVYAVCKLVREGFHHKYLSLANRSIAIKKVKDR